MQYILTEEELKSGCELVEAWIAKTPEEQLQNRQKELHEEGFFTCVTDHRDGYAELKVYQRL